MLKYAAAAVLSLPACALAQSVAGTAEMLSKDAPSRWAVGAGVSVRASPYAGEGTRVRPMPLVNYDGSRVFWRGLYGGVHLVRGDAFRLDAIVAGRFDGFDISDLGRKQLVRNGLDPRLLEDRDDGVDVGMEASWRGSAGVLKMRAVGDVSGVSDGYELGVDYGYPVRWGGFTIVPALGARLMSGKLVDYYYGTLDKEVARGVTRYQPGSAVVPQVGVGASRQIGQRWKLTISADYKFLPGKITDSPLMEPGKNGSFGIVFGISRQF